MDTGIYGIRNKVNNKLYIGQSNNIQKRWNDHKSKLKSNKHPNKHLQSSYNKYGKDNFYFFIISYCDKSELGYYEKYFIKEYKTNLDKYGYNNSEGGEGEGYNYPTISKYGYKYNKQVYSVLYKKEILKSSFYITPLIEYCKDNFNYYYIRNDLLEIANKEIYGEHTIGLAGYAKGERVYALKKNNNRIMRSIYLNEIIAYCENNNIKYKYSKGVRRELDGNLE